MKLRPYQEKCLEASAKAAANGITRQLWVLATGLGKTVMVSAWIARRGAQGTYGVMHREELLEQSREKIREWNPEAQIGIEKADSCAPPGSHIVLASVQSVGRKGAKRLQDKGWIRQLWIDEAHHAPADGYLRVADHYGFRGEEGQAVRRDAILIGTTATPDRLDRLGYDTLFDDVTFRYDLPDAIKDGWLADVHAYRIETDLDLSEVGTRQGDFATGELAKALTDSNVAGKAAKTWKDSNKGPSIFFCVDKAHAAITRDCLLAAGANAELVTDETKKEDRRSIVERYKRGNIDCLVNVGVFTEGFDAPDTRAIYMLRPTKSRALYMQCLGRGTRLAPSKQFVELFDFTPGNALACGPAGIFGLPDAWQLAGQSLSGDKEELEALQSVLPLDLSRATSLASVRTRASRISLFRQSLEDDALPSGTLTWMKSPGQDRWRIGWRNPAPHQLGRLPTQVLAKLQAAKLDPKLFGTREHLELFQNELGAWEVSYGGALGVFKICTKPSQREAILTAEAKIQDTRPHVVGLLRKGLAWRKQAATDAQRGALRRKGISEDLVATVSKGEASALMDMGSVEIQALLGGSK